MESPDGIGDDALTPDPEFPDQEFTPSQHEGDEVTSGDVIGTPSVTTATYPKPKQAKTPQQRADDLADTIRNFRIAHAGEGLLRGGFGNLPDNFKNLDDQMAQIQRSVDQFHLEGDSLTVSGSFNKGYTVQRENECVGCEGGGPTPPPPDCPTHLSIQVCFQYGGATCYVNISETIEVDVIMECPLDLTTSGCKMLSNDFLLSSQVWAGPCPDPGVEFDITGAYWKFYPICLFFDVSTGWSFTPEIVFPNWPLGVLSSGVNLGFVDLIADGPFESDPSDGPCPCWDGTSSVQCNHYVLTFS